MARAFLDLGSNVDREASLARALRLLGERFVLVRTSSTYESAASGPPGQPPFFNVAAEIETDLPPADLRQELRRLEAQMGRVRSQDRYAPRTIDLDLTLYEDRVERGEGWEVPHPQVASEPFVLVPLAEIAPDRVHPLTGRTLAEMAADLSLGPGVLRRVGGAP